MISVKKQLCLWGQITAEKLQRWIDDAEAKGFLFSYEKLFGVKLKTETDIKNEREGKDNSITRTTRLFYVACTRAQKSLAIIAYTYDCEAVKATAMKNNWFEDDEIRLLE